MQLLIYIRNTMWIFAAYMVREVNCLIYSVMKWKEAGAQSELTQIVKQNAVRSVANAS